MVAIEDCEETTNAVKYFFESGTFGRVNRVTGTVEIRKYCRLRVGNLAITGGPRGLRTGGTLALCR
jgi:hypothetical protein